MPMNLTDNAARQNIDKCDGLYAELRADFMEFAQGQTDFQIEVFIANGEGPVHRFPAHAYRHLLAQVRPLIGEIRRVSIERERLVRKRASQDLADPDADLNQLEIDYRLEDMDLDLRGKWSTYATYDRLLSSIKKQYGPFTNADLSDAESDYWEYRLCKQMADSRTGAATGVGSGNIDSMRRAVLGSPLVDSAHVVADHRLSDPAAYLAEIMQVVSSVNRPPAAAGQITR